MDGGQSASMSQVDNCALLGLIFLDFSVLDILKLYPLTAGSVSFKGLGPCVIPQYAKEEDQVTTLFLYCTMGLK